MYCMEFFLANFILDVMYYKLIKASVIVIMITDYWVFVFIL